MCAHFPEQIASAEPGSAIDINCVCEGRKFAKEAYYLQVIDDDA